MAANDNRYFQFIAGPRRGEILVFDKIEAEDDAIYIRFKDDSRINETFVAQINQKVVTEKIMAEIDHPSNCWQFKERPTNDVVRKEQDANSGEYFEIPDVDDVVHADLTGEGGVVKPRPKQKIIDLVPPRPTPPNHSVFGKINAPAKPQQVIKDNIAEMEKTLQASANAVQQANANDPVWLMCNSAKKFDTKVDLSLVISLPKKSLYDVAKESFEGGGEKVIEYIIHNLDNQKIKDALKTALFESYDTSLSVFEPETVEEPVIGDAIPGEIIDQK